MNIQLFVDLDGVLGDFDGHYKNLFGVVPDQDNYQPPDFWDNIRNHGSFYRTQPLMKDALELWIGIHRYHRDPIILSGVPAPKFNIPGVAAQKITWVMEHFGRRARLILCNSDEKFMHGRCGDILIDDRTKYAHFWIDMGGIFVHHHSAKESLAALHRLYHPPVTAGKQAI